MNDNKAGAFDTTRIIAMETQQKPQKRFLNSFKVHHLVIIAMMAGLGIAVKPLVVSLAHLITGPLFIPGGALAGGFYMMWLVLGAALLNRSGAATLIGLVQSVMVLAVGVFGSHGIFSLVTYTVPGLAVDGVLLYPPGAQGEADHVPCGIAANLAGVILSNVIFQLPLIH